MVTLVVAYLNMILKFEVSKNLTTPYQLKGRMVIKYPNQYMTMSGLEHMIDVVVSNASKAVRTLLTVR